MKDDNPRSVNIIPKVIRMQELNINDYVAENADRNRQILKFVFNQTKGITQTLDGVKMIENFVEPNKMTQWNLTKKKKKLREAAIKQSYNNL